MTEPLAALGPAWLFCPANRPERFAKAAERADVVILDLEDGVAAADRAVARDALVANPLDPTRTVVRINPTDTPDHITDLAALEQTKYRRVMLAKTESAEQAGSVNGLEIIALCETPAGVLNAAAIASIDGVVALMWGAEDLVAGLGGLSSRLASGTYRDVARHARSLVLLAAGAAGRAAVDSVYLDVGDLEGLAAESEDAVSSGFQYKACIHPTQVPIVRYAYAPAPERIDWAQRVLAAAEVGPGVFSFEGHMIDRPVLRQAQMVLQRAHT